ncbi:MAG: hypothetical protein N3E44_00575, partial [Candidatus Bathyarchaeota archaeon]|nr:hypothetical protein [Candidatus Bathyarchaeota archaeon]
DRASVKYLLLDSLGNLVAVGVAKPKGGGVFDITFTTVETGKLALGTYSLQLIAVGEEAALPSTSSYTFTVTPPIAYFERLVRATRADIEARISVVEGRISAISTDVSRLSTMLAGLQSTVNIVLALSAVAIVVAVVAIVLSLRKK